MKPHFSSYQQQRRGYSGTPKKDKSKEHQYPLIPRRQPFQELNINPFSPRRNGNTLTNNYPGLDHVFEKESSSPLSPDRSSSIISPPSELNMSIGARAAINEHTRHIAKFGLDGSRCDYSIQNDYSPNKDDEWERLMNGTSISQASFSTTFITENDRNQTLNVTNCDQSSDFFNSSRVAMLATPEKNIAKVDEASRLAMIEGVGLPNNRRAEHNRHYSESISGSTDASHDIDQSGMAGLFNAAMRLGERIDIEESVIHKCPEEEESLVSYQDPNLSLISNHDIKLSSNEKAPSDFLHLDHHLLQESSFISYHEPELSMISNRHDPELSIRVSNEIHTLLPSYEADEDNLDDIDTKDNFLVENENEELHQLDGDDAENGIHSPPKRKKSCDGDWDSPSLNQGRLMQSKQENEFGSMSQTGTVSDFNPVFSHLEDYTTWVENEVALAHEQGKGDWVPLNDCKQRYSSNELSNKICSLDEFVAAENSKDLSKIDMGYSGYSFKDWSENRIRVPSPENSDFNVDVSEIRTTSECGSRFSRAKVDFGRQTQNQVSSQLHSLNSSAAKSYHGTSNIMSKYRALVSSNREAIGISPISGDSPSELDNFTFKSSLPSSSSSVLSKGKSGDLIDQDISQKQTCLGDLNTKPRMSRLRERYSRLDRFEDSYVMSTLNNCSPNVSEDKSISRSLLDTFDCASTTGFGIRREV